jgi:putative thioredoxin
MSSSAHIHDVDAASWQTAVIERSHEVPVVVDFWAAWCGPCRTLGPILEQAVEARGGDVVLAKLDVDSNQQLAAQFRVQGIPAVKAFKNGQVVAEFVGAQPAPTVERFIDQLVPTPADRAVADARRLLAADRQAGIARLREALELDPGHRLAAIALAEVVVDDDPDQALELVRPHRPDPAAEAVVVRAELAKAGGDADTLRERIAADAGDDASRIALARLLAAEGAHVDAVDLLLDAVRIAGEHRDEAREQLVGLFTVLGDDSDLVRATRPKLASALF